MILTKENMVQWITKCKSATILLVLFFLSFSYMLFFTQCVPFFFDDHDIHSSYVQLGFTSKFFQFVSPNFSSIFSGPRPVYSLFFTTLFPFLGLDYCAYRVAKAIVFSFLIIGLYCLGQFLFKRKIPAIIIALVSMTTFPSFIQTFGYNGSHIFAELFKVLTVLFFLKEIQSDKNSFWRQFFIFFLALSAIRSYDPSYSIAALLPLFTLLYQPKKFLRFIPLFLLIILIQFPLGIFFQTGDFGAASAYSPKLINIQHVFTDGILEYIFSPLPHYDNLYYKPGVAILTFFGFWLITITLLGIVAEKSRIQLFTKYFINNEQETPAFLDSRMILSLTGIWMVCELPTYIFLPEHAIRYLFTFLTPFTFLATYLVVYFADNVLPTYKKYVITFIMLFVIGIILTNTSYTYAFRAGWGSSFMVFEEVMNFMAEEKSKTDQTISVLYNSGSTAEEYFYVNKSATDYSFAKGITYIKTANLDEFSEDNLQNISAGYNLFYVLKRTTSVSGIGYPPISFENYQSLQEATVISGYSDNIFFDKINIFLMDILGVSYQPNKVYVYRYVDTTEISDYS